MLELSNTVSYVETWTITGKKVIIGDRSANAFTLISKKEHELFFELIKLLNMKLFNQISELPEKYHSLAYNLQKRGYFNDEVAPHGSFNEYNSLSTIFFTKEISKKERNENTHILVNIIYFLVFMCICLWNIHTFDIEIINISFSGITFVEILSSIIFLPILIMLTHEVGHYMTSLLAGVEVATLNFGFAVVYPSIYLTYKGLNICKTSNKLMVISGGVFMHLVGMFIGVLFLKNGYNSIFLKLWVLSNLSMIYANVIPITASDGYFMLTSILGIYNIRLRGYKTLNKWLHGKKGNRTDILYGILMIFLWGSSFWGLHSFFDMIAQTFYIETWIVNFSYTLVTIVLIARFVIKIFQMRFDKL